MISTGTAFAFRERMRTRALPVPILILGIAAAVCSACGPTMPPTQAPAQPDSTFEPLRVKLQAYIDQTQPYRKEAAQAQQSVGGKAQPNETAAAAVRTRQNVLAETLRTKLRPTAKQGEIIAPSIGDAIKKDLADAFNSPRRDLIMDELAEQNTTPSTSNTPAINDTLQAPRVPPRLMEILPPLPKQLEYDFVGRTLVLRDVDAEVVVDYLPNALPVDPPSGVPSAAPAKLEGGATSPLAMPNARGSTTFAIMGDSGSGDVAQQQVADAMLTYFNTARHFPFVVMLGDNLYHDDYQDEFLIPYKALLDRGVKFYATLGNHDRDLEQHFKPFNMGDKDHYSFDEGNARFVALNSNHPNDVAQIKWLDTVYNDAGDKWRIAFFHHPLYSSGIHSAEGRDVIRPAFEEPLVRNRVNVVLSGHEHLYERIRPQRGIYHFVSGGGGRSLYDYKASDFDEVGASEHHFMVAQIAGDTMLFEAITHAQKVLDCGAIYRTQNAQEKPSDDTKKWLASCEQAKPRITTTRHD
jgi:Calcineurin-like phosphoesterase